ncbi:HGxxPAAW family protein [Luteococcus sp. OSA5]|uniref:HGxxPAAW family protein n=1 Tax=Luteococcus sp. OSA5 TaxID=3401630 RepID=UPI003B43B7C1
MSHVGNQMTSSKTPKLKVKHDRQLHYEEGKSPAAWAGTWIAMAGFLALTYFASFGFAKFGWTAIIVCSAIVLIGGLVTLLMKGAGYGTPARDL